MHQAFGDGFKEKFWPIFQVRFGCAGAGRTRTRHGPFLRMRARGGAVVVLLLLLPWRASIAWRLTDVAVGLRVWSQAFNSILPVHEPEQEPPDQTPAAALAAFLPAGK